MNPPPSCSININPDTVTFHGFDPSSDSSLRLRVLQEAKAKLDDEMSKPQPDRYLELCSKKKKLLVHMIEQTLANSASAQPIPEIRTYPRKEKRIMKAMRRKAARADQLRK